VDQGFSEKAEMELGCGDVDSLDYFKDKSMIISNNPHRRYNQLTGDWVLVSPHRTKRPWQGRQEEPNLLGAPSYDTNCYLCPGNTRANDSVNPDYQDIYSFTNDFPALLPVNDEVDLDDSLLQAKVVKGISRVICYSPDHSRTFPEMDVLSIEKVVDLWVREFLDLAKEYKWVQIFENKGAIMGCSNPHPHGQIWASNQLPNESKKEDIQQKRFFDKNDHLLLLAYLEQELALEERIVVKNEHWVVLVPFWALWPFEVLLLPRRQILRLPELTSEEKKSLADISKRLLTKYDNLFNTSFPYSMGWHNAPNLVGCDPVPEQYQYWQLHAHFYPPLLRSATVKKFLVGYEMLAEAQRDITAEQAASQLRDQPESHYKTRGTN
jgi:UDPglucose--hexose-1-phosphate uridylyltransferase